MTHKELYEKQYKELNNYYLLEDAIIDCDDKLREIESGMYHSPRLDDVVSAPLDSNGIEDARIKIREQRAEYIRRKVNVELYIDSIDDLLMRRIFEKRFYDRKK